LFRYIQDGFLLLSFSKYCIIYAMTSPDGGSPFEYNRDPSDEAADKLREYQSELADPQVAEFAHLVADRIHSSLEPTGFILASELLIYDLKKGVSGFTGEPIESSLVGLSATDFENIRRSLPMLAKASFSEEFASEVEHEMLKVGLITPPESVDGQDLTENEIITEDIETIDVAYEKIVADARDRLADLDWQVLGISTEDVYQNYNADYPLILRNAPFILPLNILVDKPEREAGRLLETPEAQKKNIGGDYWLAMMLSKIPAAMATVTRDHLFLKGIDAVASSKGLDPETTLTQVGGQDKDGRGPVTRAATRVYHFMKDHPEMLKKGQKLPE